MGLLNGFRQLGLIFTSFTERWVPDAWIISMMLTALAMLLCIFGAADTSMPLIGRVEATVLAWGDGVWLLLGLAMQFSIAMVAASAVVASPPMYRFFDWLASLPNPEKPVQAVMLAAIFSLITGYLNWAVCLVSCALFTPFILKRNPNTDVRVLIAAAYIGIGTVWHGGLSGSAPLILATPDNPLLNPTNMAPVVDRLYPGREQPETARPRVVRNDLEDGRFEISISCETKGASIEYRLVDVDGNPGGWRIYTEPFVVTRGATVESRAVRYGWAESGVARRPTH